MKWCGLVEGREDEATNTNITEEQIKKHVKKQNQLDLKGPEGMANVRYYNEMEVNIQECFHNIHYNNFHIIYRNLLPIETRIALVSCGVRSTLYISAELCSIRQYD